MDSDHLSDHLAKLHEELKSVQGADPRSNQLLSDVLMDIQRLLNKPSGVATSDVAMSPPATSPPATAPADATNLAGRLENVAVQFEADHPTLAASSRRLIDLLGNAGL